MAEPEIIALGSINVDLQVRTERWPEPGETLLGRDFAMLGGGKAANVAYLARRLGHPARLIGHVGDDVLADHALRPLRDAGVNLRFTVKLPHCATAVSMITVRGGGDKAIVLASNANDSWDEAAARRAAAAVRDAPDGSLLVADLEVPVQVVQRAAQAARARGFRVVLDPSPADRMTDDLYPLAAGLTPNPPETHTLTGIDVREMTSAVRAGEQLVKRGVQAAFVKLGNGGCAVVTSEGGKRVTAPKVKVVDKTGAGDCFAGALGVAMLEGRHPIEAARFAAAAAAFAVTGYGSQPSYPSRADVERLLTQTNAA